MDCWLGNGHHPCTVCLSISGTHEPQRDREGHSSSDPMGINWHSLWSCREWLNHTRKWPRVESLPIKGTCTHQEAVGDSPRDEYLSLCLCVVSDQSIQEGISFVAYKRSNDRREFPDPIIRHTRIPPTTNVLLESHPHIPLDRYPPSITWYIDSNWWPVTMSEEEKHSFPAIDGHILQSPLNPLPRFSHSLFHLPPSSSHAPEDTGTRVE